MLKVLRAISVLLHMMLLVLMGGCMSRSDAVNVQSSENVSTVQSEATGSDWELPSNYITHTDAAGLFSVSYPPEWEENPNPKGVDLLSTEYVIESLASGNPMEQWGPIFFWGVSIEAGYHPSCNIVVEPLHPSLSSVQQVMVESIASMDAVYNEFEEVSLQILVIDGRESAILEYKAKINGVDVQSLILVTIVGDTVWTNGCLLQLRLADYGDYETDFYNMVRSLKIHK